MEDQRGTVRPQGKRRGAPHSAQASFRATPASENATPRVALLKRARFALRVRRVRRAWTVVVSPRSTPAAAGALLVVESTDLMIVASPQLFAAAAAREQALPCLLPADARPHIAVGLRELHHLPDDAASVIALATLADWRVRVLAPVVRLSLAVALRDDAHRDLLEQRGRCGHELPALAPRGQHLVADVDDLFQEEVVEDTIAPHHDDIALVDRDAVYSAALLDHLDGYFFVEVGVYPIVKTTKLQWALRVTIDALHLGMEDCLEELLALQTAQHEQLAVPHREHGDHRMELPVDPGAVVQDGQERRRGPVALRGLVGIPHQGDGTPVRAVQLRALVREELCHRELLAAPQELVGELRRIEAEVLYLRDAVGDAQHHGRDQGRVRVPVAGLRLQRVGLLVRAGVEAEGLVLLVLLGQVLLVPPQLLEVVLLPLGAYQEGRGAPEAALHGGRQSKSSGPRAFEERRSSRS
mmetsp:Transcript_19267/g.54622  ORF Transcript_19267/g.54622 Transcript_19267/m.54622 type:complete len:469 (-) Transcript_19267:15-1421(-)